MSASCFSLSHIIVNDLHVIKPFKLVATCPSDQALDNPSELGLICGPEGRRWPTSVSKSYHLHPLLVLRQVNWAGNRQVVAGKGVCPVSRPVQSPHLGLRRMG